MIKALISGKIGNQYKAYFLVLEASALVCYYQMEFYPVRP